MLLLLNIPQYQIVYQILSAFSLEILFLAKPVLPGKLDVKYKLEHAILTWPKPRGIYTRQVIEKWKNKADGECQASTECDEYDVKIEQSRKLYVVIIPVNKEEEANFRLVLYYKNDSVAVFEPPTGKINIQNPFKVK